jgi:hypothetical protein
MNPNIKAAIAALALLAGLPVASFGQVLVPVLNSSFENPTLAPGAFTDYLAEPNTIPDWTNPNVAGVQHMTGSNYSAIPDGVNVAFDDGGTIAQVLSFALEPGTYDLTVAAGWRNGKIFAPGSIGLYTAGGTPLGTLSLVSPGTQGTFQDETLQLDVAPTNPYLGQDLQIELTVNNQGTGTVDFDNVRLFYTAPEPSTYALALGGLLALGFMAWRRRAVRAIM